MKDKTMTIDEKRLLARICETFNKELALMLIYFCFPTLSKSTFNKYWKAFSCKRLK